MSSAPTHNSSSRNGSRRTKLIQAVVDHVEEKRITEGVCVFSGDPTGHGLSGREREREKAGLTYRGVAVFGIERMGILLRGVN